MQTSGSTSLLQKTNASFGSIQDGFILPSMLSYDRSNSYAQPIWICGLISAVGAVLYAINRVYRYKQYQFKNEAITALGQKVVAERNATKYDFASQLQELDLEYILSLDITKLKSGLLEGQFTSVDLVNVFADRCYRVGRSLCLSAQENFQEALVLAAQKDEERVAAIQSGYQAVQALPLMHGIPFSVKDQIHQKGKFSSVGFAHLMKEVQTEDSPIVESYLQAGAIPLVRGNVAMGAMSIHTKNLVFGESLNPYNISRSCGGSSGGDAGLVAARCVPLGIGIDIGGSVRIPAAFTGVYGFKPSQGRVSSRGVSASRKNVYCENSDLHSLCGPIGISVDDCVLGFKVQADPNIQYYDPFQAPSPFREQDFVSAQNRRTAPFKKIGMLQESPLLPVSASVKRAMKEAKAALENFGFEVIPFTLTEEEWKDSRDLMQGIMTNGVMPDSLKDIEDSCETLMNHVYSQINDLKSFQITKTIKDFFKERNGNGRAVTAMKALKQLTPDEFERFKRKRQDFVRAISQKWQKAGIEALISPTFPHCSFKNELAGEMNLMREYTRIWNTLCFPSGVVPVTRVREDEQTFSDSYNDRWSELLNQSCEGSKGMPICLQVISHVFDDEKALGIMKVLESQINYKLDQPLDIGTPTKNASLSKLTKKNSFGQDSSDLSTQAGDSGFFNLSDNTMRKMSREFDDGIMRKMSQDNYEDDDSI